MSPLLARFLLQACLVPCTAALAQQAAATGPRPEVRLDIIAARRSTLQVGAGFNVVAGPYVRWGGDVAAGMTEHAGRRVATWRADAVLRFVLDPFYESRRGLYGLAGVSLMDDGARDVEPRILVGFGVEGRAHRGAIPSVEFALGGGVRVAAVVRRARANRR